MFVSLKMKSPTILILACLPAILFCRNVPTTFEGNNPEEGEFFQGDILLVPGQFDKNGILLDSFRWPNATVYYKLEGVYESDEAKKELVMLAIADFHNRTCIKFEPYDDTQTAYVVLTDVNATSCVSFIGRLGTKQTVGLQIPGCDKVGIIIHELMHAVGFFHEQMRMDRNDYVDIIWENIGNGHEHNFWELPSNTYNVSYDYGSVMHYAAKAFSSNGNDTIIPKDPNAVIGQRVGLSDKDVIKINAMYNCTGLKSNTNAIKNNGSA